MSLRFQVSESVYGCIPSNKQVRDKVLFNQGQILELVGYGVTPSACEYTTKYKVVGTENVFEIITSTYYGLTPFVKTLVSI